MSMLDLFGRHKPVASTCYPPLDRAATCATMSSLLLSSSKGSDVNELWGESKHGLRRCATAATTRPTTKSGWGIVPVLNELERRSSSNTLLLRRQPSAKQTLCLNCRRLYFPSDSWCTPQSSPTASSSPRTNTSVPLGQQFCSLDCRSSFECHASTQDFVDLQLQESSATSSDGDDGTVITLDDDTDLFF